ncbi:MAG: lamin tail domain-containing protein [Myxococcaceae bacterium]
MTAVIAISFLACAEVDEPKQQQEQNPAQQLVGDADAGGSEVKESKANDSVDAGAVENPPVEADAGTSPVVVNEICARGLDFLELANATDQAVDLSGFGVADSEDDGGVKTEDALRFPAGTTVNAGAQVLIMLGRVDAGVTTDCADAGGTCFTARWKVSNSRGEAVHILSPQNERLHSVNYPANGAPAGMSFGRIPDKTGPFQVTNRTPGAANQP